LSYPEAEIFTPFSNITYSVGANGFFVEFGGLRNFQMIEKVSIAPHLLVAYDFDYSGVQKDGFDHTLIGA